MGISNRLRPALGRITSSVASTANYGITRVLSFTDSFNEQTSLLLDSALAHDHEQEGVVDDAPGQITPTIIGALDVEAAAPPSTIGQQGQEPAAAAAPSTPDAETKRVAKVVQTVCLFGASASLLLFINDSPRGGGGGAMYRANLGFVCLGLFTSLGLSMFSIVARPGEAAVARVQKWGMVVAVASVLVASTLRMVAMLPAASLESASIAAFVLAGVVAVVYLSLAWKFGAASSSGEHEAGVAADQV